ncbi:DUF2157 domain-containing protein [Hymenobacter aquaticus]|uniref:DUF2157 domain-containing protein n=1 Tax=Hymenobacter aquaticus TaxID=1867101 RepID=A0A4Z0Q126_9BACT|nr:DUF2157 domain-containing protein [Hymenobacter aquaticus]TGE23748.1 DUF2157 domain-containing protein [Hymenobacter aquaticus]
MTDKILASLRALHLISEEQAAGIATYEREKPFSLYYELRTLLSLGVTLLSTGLGLLIYQNIDTLGHGVIVGLIALVSAAGFGYAYRKRQPFTWQQNPNPSTGADYALLLGCLTLLTLLGYLQYQYNLFGTRYGLLVLLPTVVFFVCAYRFDHRGVLSMAITGLAAWVGVSIAPLSAFTQNDFAVPHLGAVALVLGLGLAAVGLVSEYQDRKKHFGYTYLLLGSNVALLAACTALLSGPYDQGFMPPVLAALLIIGLSAALVWYARRTHSYVFVLLGALYGYVAVTYLMFQVVELIPGLEGLLFFYFPLSTVGVVLLLLNLKKIVASHDEKGL